jgi:hypothetical protein
VIPEHISEFLRSTVKTVWALDLLRLLKGTQHRSWTVLALTAELRGSIPMVESNLEIFKSWGLVMEDSQGLYRYASNEMLDAVVVELLQIYRERPMAIIQKIAEAPNDKLKTFVDAFRIKRE